VEEAAWRFLRCTRGGLDSGEPYGADVKYIKRSGVEVAGRRYELSGAVHIVGFGKAPLKMARAVVDVLRMPWLALSFRRWGVAAWAPSRNCIATTQSPAEARYTSLRGFSST
jgi:glycerate-2-kinase